MQNKKGQTQEQVVISIIALALLAVMVYFIFFASKEGGGVIAKINPSDVTKMVLACQGYIALGDNGLVEYCTYRKYKSADGKDTYVNCDYVPVTKIVKSNPLSGKCSSISFTPSSFCSELQSNVANKVDASAYIRTDVGNANAIKCDLSKAGELASDQPAPEIV